MLSTTRKKLYLSRSRRLREKASAAPKAERAQLLLCAKEWESMAQAVDQIARTKKRAARRRPTKSS
jgi:hypothetical protein